MPTHYYEYRHVVGFEETNLVGNVYYTNHLGWQGRCRELFLKEHAPEIIPQLSNGLSLATVRCSCENFAEFNAFDEILVRMSLAALVQNRISLQFDYYRTRGKHEELIARGEQEVACMKRDGARLIAAPVPASLKEALAAYTASR